MTRPILVLEMRTDVDGRPDGWRAYLVRSSDRLAMKATAYGSTPLEAASQLATLLGAMFEKELS